MNRIMLLVVIFFMAFLTGCQEEDRIKQMYGYTLTTNDFEGCDDMVEPIGQDGQYKYYFPCLESQYHIATDVDENSFTAHELYESNLLTLKQIYNLFEGVINRTERTDLILSIDECPVTIPENTEVVGVINGYEIISINFFCTLVVGDVYVDGYYFGYIYNGCDGDIDDIGYRARKDDEVFWLSEVIESGDITVEEIYNIYICDEDKIGVYK